MISPSSWSRQLLQLTAWSCFSLVTGPFFIFFSYIHYLQLLPISFFLPTRNRLNFSRSSFNNNGYHLYGLCYMPYIYSSSSLVLTASLQGQLLLSLFNRIENRYRENSSDCLISPFSFVGKLLKSVFIPICFHQAFDSLFCGAWVTVLFLIPKSRGHFQSQWYMNTTWIYMINNTCIII